MKILKIKKVIERAEQNKEEIEAYCKKRFKKGFHSLSLTDRSLFAITSLRGKNFPFDWLKIPKYSIKKLFQDPVVKEFTEVYDICSPENYNLFTDNHIIIRDDKLVHAIRSECEKLDLPISKKKRKIPPYHKILTFTTEDIKEDGKLLYFLLVGGYDVETTYVDYEYPYFVFATKDLQTFVLLNAKYIRFFLSHWQDIDLYYYNDFEDHKDRVIIFTSEGWKALIRPLEILDYIYSPIREIKDLIKSKLYK